MRLAGTPQLQRQRTGGQPACCEFLGQGFAGSATSMPENLDLPCSTNCRVAEPLIERIMRIPFRSGPCRPEVKEWLTSAGKI